MIESNCFEMIGIKYKGVQRIYEGVFQSVILGITIKSKGYYEKNIIHL